MGTGIDEAAMPHCGDGSAGRFVRVSDVTPQHLQAYLACGRRLRADAFADLLQRLGGWVTRGLRAMGGRSAGPVASYTLAEHELKTPITSIRSAAEILRDHTDLSPDDRARFLSAVLEDSRRLERYADQLLRAVAR